MESLTSSVDLLPYFDKYAQQMLENSKTTTATAQVTTPTTATTLINSATIAANSKISNFLQEFGANFINSIQLQNFQRTLYSNRGSSTSTISSSLIPTTLNETVNNLLNSTSTVKTNNEMDIELIPNQIIIDTSSFDSMDDLQKQLDYDKFMNEVWIGIVLTLILISMIFCICSCFLYHQFRTWKRNYHTTIVQANSNDIEALKSVNDLDDPVPEYTLVSGLPSYEAALELMQKSPKSCLIVYPSVFNIFNKNERQTTIQAQTTNETIQQQTTTNLQQQQQNVVDSTTPLLTPNTIINEKTELSLPNYADIMHNNQNNNNNVNSTTLTIDLNNSLLNNTTIMNEKEILEFLNETENNITSITIDNNNDEKILEELVIIKK